MQDHLEVYIQYACTQPVSIQPHLAFWKRPFIGLAWLLRRGPAASNHFEAGAFVRSNENEPYPNLMFHFLPIAIRYDGSAPEGGHGYQVHVGPMYSDALGTVKITSTDPTVKPAVQFNYLTTEQDLREWPEAIRTARRILNQPAFEPFNGGELWRRLVATILTRSPEARHRLHSHVPNPSKAAKLDEVMAKLERWEATIRTHTGAGGKRPDDEDLGIVTLDLLLRDRPFACIAQLRRLDSYSELRARIEEQVEYYRGGATNVSVGRHAV